MSVEKVKGLCKSLSSDELRDVRDFCSLLISAGPSVVVKNAVATNAADEMVTTILDLIVEVMVSEGADVMTRTMLEKTGDFAAFRRKIVGDRGTQTLENRYGSLHSFFKTVIARNRVKRRALIKVAVRCLYQDIVRMNGAANARTMMAQVHRLPAVLNASFPGYAKAGILHLVVRGDD